MSRAFDESVWLRLGDNQLLFFQRLPLHEGEGFVAIEMYDITTDTRTFRLARQ